MKQWSLLIALAALVAPAAQAQTAVPNFTQGSMTTTTVTESSISETIVTERYAGDYFSWSGTNITPSGAVNDTTTTFSVTNTGEDFQLEIVERAAGIVELETITRTIDQNSTKNSLSIFSQ